MWKIFNRESPKEFPYKIADEFHHLGFSCLTLHKATHKEKDGAFSIFKYVKGDGDIENYEYAFKNIQRLKTIKHPNVLSYIDSYEDQNYVYLVTERVTPLSEYLANIKESPVAHEYIAWGVMKIVKALIFCHEEATFCHNHVGSNAIFVNKSGEWKLGEFGFWADRSDLVSPDCRAKSYEEVLDVEVDELWKGDMLGVAVMIQEAFINEIQTMDSIKIINEKVPPDFRHVVYPLLCAEKGTSIPTLKDFFDAGRQWGNYFQNDFIDRIQFLEEIHSKSKKDRSRFFHDFRNFVHRVPENFAKFKIFPLLVMAYEYGCEGSQVMPSILEFCTKDCTDVEIAPIFVKLFQSRSIDSRTSLLRNTDKYIHLLPRTVVNDEIFPLMEMGFQDSNWIVRTETVKASKCYVPLLNPQKINRALLPQMVTRMVDEKEDNIRKSAIEVLLGTMASYISSDSRQQVLLNIIIKALKDQHPPIREMTVNFLVDLQTHFTPEHLSGRVLPALCLLTTDPNKTVRSTAFRVMRDLLKRLEEVEVVSCQREPTTVKTTWTDWAITKLSTKLTSVFLESDTMNGIVKESQPSTNRRMVVAEEALETATKEPDENPPDKQDSTGVDETVSKVEEPSPKANSLGRENIEKRYATRMETKGSKNYRDAKKVGRPPQKLASRIGQKATKSKASNPQQ